MKRLTAEELDCLAGRLDQLELEEEAVRSKTTEQIEPFGFTPARAEKSKRILGNLFSFTVTTSASTEIRDSEVERAKCLPARDLWAAVLDQDLVPPG